MPGRRSIWPSEASNCRTPSRIYICSPSPLEPGQSALAPSIINRHALFTIIITEPHARAAQPPYLFLQRAQHSPAHIPRPADPPSPLGSLANFIYSVSLCTHDKPPTHPPTPPR